MILGLGRRRSERVAVMGLGNSGLAAALALQASGAEVWVWDDQLARRQQAYERGLTVQDLTSCSFEGIRELVWSPGIAHHYPKPHPVVVQAERWSQVRLIGDIELLARACPNASYLGVTGSNGKSTTTALIAHGMREASAAQGQETRIVMGGNFGPPALSLPALSTGEWYVLELSSFQLELMKAVPLRVGVWLNLTPDHLDRHGSMEAYRQAKERLFYDNMSVMGWAVVGVDDDYSFELYQRLRRPNRDQVIPISGERAVAGGVYVEGGVLWDATETKGHAVSDLTVMPSLRSKVNWQNSAAAYAALRAVGVSSESIVKAMTNFQGLRHRQQLVDEIAEVRLINDSKATNPTSAAKALEASGPHIYWIVGGRAKTDDWRELSGHLEAVEHAFLIGEAAPSLARWLGQQRVRYTQSGDLKMAVEQAAQMAWREHLPQSVVLLAPACTSFDQFSNFEARGESFIEMVQCLRRGSF